MDIVPIKFCIQIEWCGILLSNKFGYLSIKFERNIIKNYFYDNS